MESKKLMMMMMVVAMVMGMVVGQGLDPGGSGGGFAIPFVQCYGQCYFFCIIEPQNMCTCTSTCLKQCLDTPSPSAPATMELTMDQEKAQITPNIGYCKLGCAISRCSHISQPHSPERESMGRCVDGCSNECAMGY